MPRSPSPQTRHVLQAFLGAPGHKQYGYGISRATGLKSGTLYPILMRLAEQNLVEAKWETGEPGRPPRHVYRLTPAGLRLALESQAPARRAASGPLREAKSS